MKIYVLSSFPAKPLMWIDWKFPFVHLRFGRRVNARKNTPNKWLRLHLSRFNKQRKVR